MEEDVPQTLQRVVQDVIVPDLRELKVHFAANYEIEMSKIAVLSAKIAANHEIEMSRTSVITQKRP